MRSSVLTRSALTVCMAALGAATTMGAMAPAWGQAISVNGGSIQGTITDTSGAVISGATIVITATETGTTTRATTDAHGFYTAGPLNPGTYKVAINATGFEQLVVNTVIRTGTATPGSFSLTVGSATQTVEVTSGAVQLNTDQAGVSDVVTQQQIQTLPINGRNILDVAQVEPGVILESGESFDPTKAGYSAISVSGVAGRTTRILLDGQDVTDETVGTTITNIPSGAIGEFQMNRSTQDVSGEVTSTGQVLMSTQSGTNSFHGSLFYWFQDNNAGDAYTTGGYNAPFQRNQFGGNIGGPILKDKAFFFADVERIKQDADNSATTSTLFSAIQAQYPVLPAPFRDTYSTARIDYNAPHGIHLFARGFYEPNADDSNFGFLYSIYTNRDNTPGFAGGADFVTGKFTHSFRGSYEKFHNLLVDGTAALGSSIYNPIAGLTLYDAPDNFFAGVNYLAPQGTFQSDKQFRYDGSWTKGAHNLRYGYSLNRILGGGFAEFFGASLFTEFSAASVLPNCGGVAGAAPCPGDPVNGYSPSGVILGNGNSVFTEKPGFGLPGGGTEDWREAAYIADNWQLKPSFTLTAGLRWSIDTDRANQDLPSPPCSSVSAGLVNPCANPNSGYLFDAFEPGLGGKTEQNYADFGPQLGFAYNPAAAKNTVFRGGVGIFYDSDIFNNTGNARSAVIDQGGPFFNDTAVCGGTNSVPLPGGGTISGVGGVSLSTICSESIAQAAPALEAVLAQYQAATKANNNALNPAYIGQFLQSSGVYAHPYKTPYALQYNFGIQQQLSRGMLLSADFVHNTTLKLPLVLDVNHVGAAQYMNLPAAQNAIAATLAACGVTSVQAAITACPGLHATGGATIDDFASNGLDSDNAYLGGYPATVYGLTPSTGAAFPGANPNVGLGDFILPKGQSEYNALQIVFKEQKTNPIRYVTNSNLQLSYSYSSIISDVSSSGNQGNSGDQFFNNPPYDTFDPHRYMGWNGLDHRNELSLGGSFNFKYGPKLGLVGHFFSSPPSNLTLDNLSGNTAQIFMTDVTGDGTVADLVPGTRPGSYMRDYQGAGLNKLINQYNATYANQATPAGQALINAGLFTLPQLQALGGVQQQIATVPTTPIANPAFREVDASVSYPIHLSRMREGMYLEPGVSMYNVINASNFGDLTGTLLNTSDAGGTVGTTPDFLNGPDAPAIHDATRTQRGSGTFDQGGPRSTEFRLNFNF